MPKPQNQVDCKRRGLEADTDNEGGTFHENRHGHSKTEDPDACTEPSCWVDSSHWFALQGS
jgi:hypothetical protein